MSEKRKIGTVTKISRNGCGNVEDQSVANAELHLALTISYVSDALHLIYQLLIRCPYANLDAIEVFFVDMTRSDCFQHCFADRAIHASIL